MISITISILCIVGIGTILYFAMNAEEFIMKRLTGAGIIESGYRILREMQRFIKKEEDV